MRFHLPNKTFDKWSCPYCGIRLYNNVSKVVDFIIPRFVFKLCYNNYYDVFDNKDMLEHKESLGDVNENKLICCLECDRKKSDKIINPYKDDISFLGERINSFMESYTDVYAYT